MDLKSKLNTAKGITSGQSIPRSSVNTFVGNVDELTEAVFSNKRIYDENSEQAYDADAEMKMLKSGLPTENIQYSRLPDSIKESILSNPLIVTPVDPKMDAFTEKLSSIQGMGKATNINSQLDELDKAKEIAKKTMVNEIVQQSASIDYSKIRAIVEDVVKSMKNDITNEINESAIRNRRNDTSLKVMKMSDKFLFLDSDNNVFECQMVYKGKNKKK